MNDFDYPENFVEETDFPLFSGEDTVKIQSHYSRLILPDVIEFWKNNSGKKFRENCIITRQDGEDEVQVFVHRWLSAAEVEEYLNLVNEEIHAAKDDEIQCDQLIELKEKYLPLAQAKYFSRQTLLCKIDVGNEGEVFFA